MNPGAVFSSPDVAIHLARGRFSVNPIIYSDLRESVEVNILPPFELGSPNPRSMRGMDSPQYYENKGYI
jgi:hypothetical protein